jgi:asparagine synthase (glutamine-hydrolysing)
MCGIAGFLPRHPVRPSAVEARLQAMVRSQIHRGPDDEGFFIAPQIGLGMRRLAIIDRAGGHQPMQSDDGTLTLVFNGEIYNHRVLRTGLESRGCRFSTHSDTEVLLRVLETEGTRGIDRLEGMFAFALWNARERTLTLARDWLGQKSLYWVETPAGFAFASEIKALLALPDVVREPDVAALSHYMSLRYLPDEMTLFNGIRKLPAAHALHVNAQGRRLETLWRPAYTPKHSLSEGDIIEHLDELMKTVVAEHLISDVPLGAFLSGGIDSSLVVAYASNAMPDPLSTFAVGVEESSQSELPWARLVADRYATDHHEQLTEPDFAELTPRMVATLEEPVDPFGAGVYVVSRVARRHVTVALGGDGGDELFAGYDRYKGQALAALYGHLPRPLRHRLFRPLLRALPDSFGYNSFTARLRWLDDVADARGAERYGRSAAHLRFGHEAKARLFEPGVWQQIGATVTERLLERYFTDGSADAALDRILHADCMTRLSDNQLPITDRMSMAHSLELRSPFLDRRIAEFAMKIPAGLKLRHRRLKHVTRRLGERYLPKTLLDRPKKGFGFPLALWLRGPLRTMMQRTIDDSRLVEQGLFRREELQRLHDEHASGRVDHNYRLWMVFNLETFWRHFIDGEPVERVEEWVAGARAGRAASAGGVVGRRAGG